MESEQVQNINAIIDKAADRLGMAVTKLTPATERLIQELQWRNIAGCIASVVIALVVITALEVALHQVGKTYLPDKPQYFEENGGDPTGYGFLRVISWVIEAVAIIICVMNSVGYILDACAPTWAFVQHLLR